MTSFKCAYSQHNWNAELGGPYRLVVEENIMRGFNTVKLFIDNAEVMWLNQHYLHWKRFLVLTLLLPLTMHRSQTQQFPILSSLLTGSAYNVYQDFVSRMTAASVPEGTLVFAFPLDFNDT